MNIQNTPLTDTLYASQYTTAVKYNYQQGKL